MASMESSNEMFALDAQGKKTDSEIHADLLKQPDSEATKRYLRQQLLDQGITEESIRRNWPDLI